MKRRQIIQFGGAALISAAGSVWAAGRHPILAQANSSVLIEYLGHTCFLISGGGRRILVNPFRTIGCTAGYSLPKVRADLVLLSSQLWDEGAPESLPGNPKILYEAGVYEINGFRLQGIDTDHDRKGGRQFGRNVVWRWKQGGVNLLHLGGAAAPITLEQKILMGVPDVAFVPVGGGPKAYGPEDALQAMDVLRPRILIPTQYLTAAADKNGCDLVGVERFLELAKDKNVQQLKSNQLRVSPQNLPKTGTLIRVLSYRA